MCATVIPELEAQVATSFEKACRDPFAVECVGSRLIGVREEKRMLLALCSGTSSNEPGHLRRRVSDAVAELDECS